MWNQDPYEYLTSDTFWALGIFIAANAVWIDRQKKLLGKPKNEDIILEEQASVTDNGPVGNAPADNVSVDNTSIESAPVENVPTDNEPTNNTSSVSSPLANASTPSPEYAWLDLHITSRPRQIIATAVATLILPLLLLEGVWAIILAFLVTVEMLKATYPSFKPRILGFVLYLPLTLIMLLVWFILLNTSSYLVIAQWKYIHMLVHYRPSAGDRSSPEEEGLMDSDGEWRDLENGEGVQSGERSEGEEKASK
ncbi:hypothetical protein BGZ61DRAFT_454509 [Ilyonectria robusta]|uniref:uncharacterized protein n=1 Tax=Ilyonectria robusta TaxID=1079257 RepID=UPI001E8DB515|nr:uncharacterized protein BGZ61DRAFT_454509 [Ilyonectria robusta]KAH8686465.1 hypothetical protein BGZ61DRAFT_454509 [Ilyonectria robusta]